MRMRVSVVQATTSDAVPQGNLIFGTESLTDLEPAAESAGWNCQLTEPRDTPISLPLLHWKASLCIIIWAFSVWVLGTMLRYVFHQMSQEPNPAVNQS